MFLNLNRNIRRKAKQEFCVVRAKISPQLYSNLSCNYHLHEINTFLHFSFWLTLTNCRTLVYVNKEEPTPWINFEFQLQSRFSCEWMHSPCWIFMKTFSYVNYVLCEGNTYECIMSFGKVFLIFCRQRAGNSVGWSSRFMPT